MKHNFAKKGAKHHNASEFYRLNVNLKYLNTNSRQRNDKDKLVQR